MEKITDIATLRNALIEAVNHMDGDCGIIKVGAKPQNNKSILIHLEDGTTLAIQITHY